MGDLAVTVHVHVIKRWLAKHRSKDIYVHYYRACIIEGDLDL